ncbi:MAG: hypothetical protein F4X91_13375 [Nitrospinae bacterium]|nr:hypothetical protein [Nitrospinota bacterium]
MKRTKTRTLLDAGTSLIPEGRSLVPEPLCMAASRAADGATAFSIAALNGRPEMVDMLMKASAVPSPDGPLDSPSAKPLRTKGVRIPPSSPCTRAVLGRK